MAATVIRRRLFRLYKISFQPLLVSLLAVLSSDAISGNWQFGTRAESSLSYIDNINLATEADAESSNVFELTPGFSLIGAGRRLQVNADYRLQSLFYSNNPDMGGGSDSKYFHRLSSSANSELIERLLFVDAAASVTQQSSSEIGRGTVDNFSLTDDRGTVNKLSLSPYFLHQVGNGLKSELRYRYDELHGDKEVVTNSTIQTVALKMDSGNLAGRWQWSLNARTSEVDYKTQSDQTHYSTDVGISQHIFSRTVISLHGGTEKVKYRPSSVGETGGDYWMLGMDWRPGKRTSISLQAGERYYGESFSLSLQHKARRAKLGLEYTEDLTNRSIVQLEQQLVAVGTTTTPEVYPVLNTDVILRKTLSGHIEWHSAKSTITLRTSDTDYDFQVSDSTERTQSTQAGWQWRTSHNMAFNLSGYYQHRKLSPTDRTESVSQVEIKLSRTIWPGASTSVSVVSTNRNTDDSSQDYSQKRFTLAINMKW